MQVMKYAFDAMASTQPKEGFMEYTGSRVNDLLKDQMQRDSLNVKLLPTGTDIDAYLLGQGINHIGSY